MVNAMSLLENEVVKYRRKGFEVKQKRTLKHGMRVFLARERGGISGLLGGFYGIYMYVVDGDSNPKNITEFLKDYGKFYDAEKFDTEDRGIFFCSGKMDKELFRDLCKAVVKDKEIASTIRTKSLPAKVTLRKDKKVIEKERIKERITEREITRRKITEERISVKGVVNKIKKFEPPTKPKKEKQLENMLVSNLQAFYDVRTQLTYERARIDAKIGNVGIEVKYQPSSGDFDRLYGQIEKYLKHLDYVIVVIGYEKSIELTKSFKERLKERGWLNKQVYVITK